MPRLYRQKTSAFHNNSVTYERAKCMEDDLQERLLYPASYNRGSIKVESDYEEFRTELMKGKGMILRFIWDERYC